MSTKPDFPYYNDRPVAISPLGWVAILASVATAFVLLITLPFPAFPLNLLPAIAFTGLPLLTLAAVSRGHHTALFGRFGVREFALAIGFGLLTLVASFAVGLLLWQFTSMTANPSAATLVDIGPADMAIFLVRTAIQLVGEELLTILPLLAVLWLCVRKFGLPRRVGLVIAVLVSTIWFASVHLPTYNWNVIQCFGGIGMARLVLTAAFLVTRNLWVSAGAHILNDWTEFLLPTLLAGHAPIEPGA
jgi:membrane protease YdiL (CAAX protease family)